MASIGTTSINYSEISVVNILKLISHKLHISFLTIAMNPTGYVRFFPKILTIHKIYATVSRTSNNWITA